MSWPDKKRSVLVPFDFSMAAKDALEVAGTFAATPNAVDVLYVVTPPPILAPGSIWGVGLQEEEARGHAHENLVQALKDGGHSDFSPHIRIGRPADEIVDFAASVKSDLIVIPSNGRTGVQRALLGSVTERVVRLAPCPVLVLRATDVIEGAGS